jgi:FAD:protein FMN transferase
VVADRGGSRHRTRSGPVGDDGEDGEYDGRHEQHDHHDHRVRSHHDDNRRVDTYDDNDIDDAEHGIVFVFVFVFGEQPALERDHEVVMSALAPTAEELDTFDCFGGTCTVIVSGDGAAAALAVARERLLGWHEQFSRFRPDSELSRLNRDPRTVVPVSPMLRRVVEAGIRAAADSGGLVDPTLVGAIERAGYGSHFYGEGLELPLMLELAPARAPAGPSSSASWSLFEVDRRGGTVTRPPGAGFDPGGIAKGVFADELGALLSSCDAFVVDCAGDIRLGGRAGIAREVHVESPFDESILHTYVMTSGGVTTSGVGRRSWLGLDGAPAHHLLDPATGRPAFTGVVQATALAPTAAGAEMLSKAAVLSGPEAAERWLVHGGLIVYDDGSHRLVEPAPG